MATTIQISSELLAELKKRKLHEKESYEEVIWDLIEDTMELSDETKRNIAFYEKNPSKTIPLEEVKRRLGL
jgi:predicted CopG family antitoxin